jgi:manganese oxidase
VQLATVLGKSCFGHVCALACHSGWRSSTSPGKFACSLILRTGSLLQEVDAYWSTIKGQPFDKSQATRTRTYYLQAEEVDWDYAPTGMNEMTGMKFTEEQGVFVSRLPGLVGSVYKKCLYRQYAGPGFGRQVPAEEKYLGFLGPVIRAEVGDNVTIHFRNRCSFPASVHPHGLFYDKLGEGSPYKDGTNPGRKRDDVVATGGEFTYSWHVPERAGPGPRDGSSVMWMYHSHANEIADTYAGLSGIMVVTAKGMAREDGSPKDVDTEVFLMYQVIDENNSPYFDGNQAKAAPMPKDLKEIEELEEEVIEESNLMHAINGYVYGTMPMVVMNKDAHVRWYVMAMGTEVDLHTPHWHGNTVVVRGYRTDVLELLPASMVTADMVPDSTGIWMMHCHVNDHITAGMSARYQVNEVQVNEQKALSNAALSSSPLVAAPIILMAAALGCDLFPILSSIAWTCARRALRCILG